MKNHNKFSEDIFKSNLLYLIENHFYRGFNLSSTNKEIINIETGESSYFKFNIWDRKSSCWKTAINKNGFYFDHNKKRVVRVNSSSWYVKLGTARNILKYIIDEEKPSISYPIVPSQYLPATRIIHLDIDYHNIKSIVNYDKLTLEGKDYDILKEEGFVVYPSSKKGVYALLILDEDINCYDIEQYIKSLQDKLEGKIDKTNLNSRTMSLPTFYPKGNSDYFISLMAKEALINYFARPLEDIYIKASNLFKERTETPVNTINDVSTVTPSLTLAEKVKFKINTTLNNIFNKSKEKIINLEYINESEESLQELRTLPFTPNIEEGNWWQALKDKKIFVNNIDENNIEEFVRSISQNVSENKIKERIYTIKRYKQYLLKNGFNNVNGIVTDELIEELIKYAKEAYPKNHKIKDDELEVYHIYIATVLFCFLFRYKKDNGEVFLTHKILIDVTEFESSFDSVDYGTIKKRFHTSIMKKIYNKFIIIKRLEGNIKELKFQRFAVNIYELTEQMIGLSTLIPCYNNPYLLKVAI